jgi:hypothetical protein
MAVPASAVRGGEALKPAQTASTTRPRDASRSRSRASFPAPSVARRVSTLLPPRARGDAPAPAPTLRGAGAPMPGAVRARLEASLGADLGAVRVHPADAVEPAPGPGVRAFAYGDHVVLGSGERATDLGLMAHEAAHVLQQRGGGAVPQTSAADASGALEHEADRVSAAVVAGEPARVQGRTAPRPQFQLGWLRRAAGAVVGAVGDVAGAALRFIRERAVHIPGYALLAFVIGRDPVTQQPVERSAANLVRGLMGLWPGGELFFQALQRYEILDRVGAWLRGRLDTLGGIVSGIRTALDRFIATLGAADILSPAAVFDRARRIFADPAERALAFVRGLAGDVLGFVRDAVLRPIARLAEGTRGYDLLKLVLGRDPITGESHPPTAANVIGGFMRLIGQEEKWRHLQESRAIPRAWAWFQQQLGVLTGFVREVPALFLGALRSLQIRDLLDLGGAFSRMRGIFGGFVSRFVSWAGDAALQVMMFIFEVLAPGAMPVLRRAAGVIRTIVGAPVAFVGNLVRAGLRGFQQFRENIRTHLVNGLVGWLTGALAGAGLQLPARWDARGILSLALQVLGLTWQNIRQKLLRHVPEPVLRGLEAGFDLVVTLVREGPAAAWRQILEHLQNLQEMVFGQIREWVTRTVVGQAVVRILSMLNPAGAVIQAIIAIYNTIMFFRERLQQIMQVAEAFFNSIAAIAAGSIGAAATRVEQTMGRLVPVVISFLARLIGLGGISDTIRNLVARIRAPVDRALDRVVDWLVAQARRLGRAVAAGARRAAGAVADWWRAQVPFTSTRGQSHRLFFAGQGAGARLKVASVEMFTEQFIARVEAAFAHDPLIRASGAGTLAACRQRKADIDRLQRDLENARRTGTPGVERLQNDLRGAMQQMSAYLARLVDLLPENQVTRVEVSPGDYISLPYRGTTRRAEVRATGRERIHYRIDALSVNSDMPVTEFQRRWGVDIGPSPEEGSRAAYMGGTPGKASATGRTLIREKYTNRNKVRHAGPVTEIEWEPARWHDLDDCDMSHDPVDAVDFWMNVARPRGYLPRGPEIRAWMLDWQNYILEPASVNRGRASRNRRRYLPP